LSTLARIEREKIAERTKAGLQRVKSKGVKLGRKAIPEDVKKVSNSPFESKIPELQENNQKVANKTKFGKVHHVSL
jgi:DNA invertase Pin-like site-specific DNA recombinase